MSLRLIDLNAIPHMIEGTTTLDEQVNSDISLTVELFDTPINRPITSKITESWRVAGVNGPGDNTEYVVKRKEVKSLRRSKVLTLNCVPYYIEVLNTRRLYTYFEGEFDVKTVLDAVFQDLPFSYELSETVDATNFMDTFGDGQTRLEVFKTALETWELEFKLEKKVFKLSKYINRKPDYFISDEINAHNVVQEVDGTEFYTYARGFGDLSSDDPLESAGIKEPYQHPLSDIPMIGIKEAPPLRLEDETSVDKLRAKLKKYVDTSLKISITCDFISLQKEWPQAVAKLADEVTFKANNIDFIQDVRLIAISTKRNHKGDILSQSTTFGDAPLGKRHRADVNHAAQYIKDLKAGNRKIPSSALEKAILEASSLILNAQTELDFGSSLGIVARDKTDSNNLVVFNAAGVGLSRDGGKTFENAITALGINATAIRTGKLLTDLIEVMSESGLFKLTGEKALWTHPTNSNIFTEISPKGLVTSGTLSVKRFDGGESWLVGGKNTVGQRLFGASPSFTSGNVSIVNQRFTTKSSELETVDAYYFDHFFDTIRANVYFANYSDSTYKAQLSIKGFGGFEIEDIVTIDVPPGGTTYTASKVYIGPPDKGQKQFYIKMACLTEGKTASMAIMIVRNYDD